MTVWVGQDEHPVPVGMHAAEQSLAFRDGDAFGREPDAFHQAQTRHRRGNAQPLAGRREHGAAHPFG